jgi:hypothetical protein
LRSLAFTPRLENSMAIDILQETVIPFGAVPQRFPHLGRVAEDGTQGRVHFSTVFRWWSKGIVGPGGNRVRLEGTKLGGKLVTSLEALQRFSDALTPRAQGEAPATAPRAEGKRRKASERAAEELERIGI